MDDESDNLYRTDFSELYFNGFCVLKKLYKQT